MSKNNCITWNDINWGKTTNNVRKIQYRIYKASLDNKRSKVKWLQNYLINSTAAKLLAVRQVTTLNTGKKTAGVDKIKITNDKDKVNLVISLTLDGKSQLIRRTWISKPGKTEKRPLGIPVIRDRAKQALCKLALEPEWEAYFEPNSYGFRPGRNTHDAIEAIFLALHHNKPKFVYDADIQKCFDRIDHQYLLNKLDTLPIIKRQIKSWLKAGILEGYSNDSNVKDILAKEAKEARQARQGGIICPLLANIALHGLENYLKDYVSKLNIKPHDGSNRAKAPKIKALSIIRYADDFVVIHENLEILELCIIEIGKWLKEAGLRISAGKTKLINSRKGFLFLGFQIIHVKKLNMNRYKVKIQPSKESQKKLLNKIKTVINQNKSTSSYDLIMKLRPIIIGWGNYFKYSECKSIYSKLTHLVFQKLRAWVFRRDTRSGRRAIKENDFPSGKVYTFDNSSHQDNWILNGRKKIKDNVFKETYLPHIQWIKSKKHIKVRGNASPYEGGIYWALRSDRHNPYPIRIRRLLLKQKQKCSICKIKFTSFDTSNWEIDHIIPKSKGGPDTYENLQLIHKTCHTSKTRVDIHNI
jgi:RNA-directed DNA polymerase